MRIPLFSRNGLPVMPNVWHVYEMLVQAKTIDPLPDPAKLFNDAIVEPVKRFTLPAVEELGLRPTPKSKRCSLPIIRYYRSRSLAITRIGSVACSRHRLNAASVLQRRQIDVQGEKR